MTTPHTEEKDADRSEAVDPTAPRPVPERMRAIVQETYGVPDVLHLREVDVPTPGESQVLVRVKAAALNVYDWHMTTGTPYMVRAVAGLTKPKHPIPGADLAGVVAAVGPNVSEFGVGDEVFGEVGAGAFAEYAAVNVKHLAAKPAGLGFEHAASVPMAALTALQGLRDEGGLEPGQKVIVNGASGGVGTFAVQIAKALGAEVTAVCSTAKVETALSLGADTVIDYTKDDFTKTERGYDVLFDNVGNRPWSETGKVLQPGGTNVAITGPKHRWLGPMRELLVRKMASLFSSKRLSWFTAAVNREDLEYLSGLLESGQVVPVIEKTYPLEQMPDALRYLSKGHAHGKLVIQL